MTDNEIIKALEKVRYHLTASQHKAVIDDAIETLLSQKAEIERLKHNIELLAICKKDLPKQTAKAIKAEAVKEVAERLKSEWQLYNEERNKIVFADDIDNLVKKMVGEG